MCSEAIHSVECVSKRYPPLSDVCLSGPHRDKLVGAVTEINSSKCSAPRSPLSRSSLNLLCRRNCNVAPLAQLGQRLREIFVLLVPLRLTLRLSLRDTTSGPSKRSRFIPWENVRENISINGHCAYAATAASRSLVFGVLPLPSPRPSRSRSFGRSVDKNSTGREGGRKRLGYPVLLDRTRYLPYNRTYV